MKIPTRKTQPDIIEEWHPQPKQEAFLIRNEDEVLYGGSKGGGKTECLLMAALYQIEKPHYRAMIFRRTFPELQELIDRSLRYFPSLGGEYNSATHRWYFPSGASIQFGSMANPGDEYNYQGREFQFIGFDQLEEFTENQYLFLVAQCRTSDPTIQTSIRATANPGNIGHVWVRKRFLEGKEPNKTYTTHWQLPYPINGMTEMTRTLSFVPATVYDNKKLLEANPGYLTNLLQLPDNLRKALLEGNWDVFEGQYFAEWDRQVHTCTPFAIPRDWKRYRGLDHGSFAPTACLWFALDPNGEIYCYREHYQVNKLASAHAQRIKELSADEDIAVTYADPSMWISQSTDGKSAAEIYNTEGVPLTKANNNRVNGWTVVREYFKRPPRLHIFSTCSNLIRTIPELIHDERRPEDLNTDGEDHLADALRYFLISRSYPAQPKVDTPPIGSFLWTIEQEKKKREYTDSIV